MNQFSDKLSNQYPSEDLELSATIQIPLISTKKMDQNSIHNEFYINEEKSIPRVDQLNSQDNFNKREAKKTLLLQNFNKKSYIGNDEILALNKVYSEIMIDGKQNRERRSKFLNSSIYKQYPKVLQMVPILEPTSGSLITWNLFVSLIIIFYFFEIPVYLAWGNQFWTSLMPLYAVKIVTIFSYTFLTMDVCLQFITAYYFHGNLITKKPQIAINYLRNNFVYDMIAIIGFAFRVSLKTNNIRWIYFLFYFKLPSLIKIGEQFDEIILLKRTLRCIYQVGKIVLFMFYAFVLFGCFFYILGEWSVSMKYNSWLTSPGNFGLINTLGIHEQFFLSFYFSLGTMSSTMGYGDIIPLNEYECAYCLLGIIFAVMILAINIRISPIIIEYLQSKSIYLSQYMIAINRFLKTNNVPGQLSERVRQYLNEYWFEEGSRDTELEHKTIHLLAPELREELMYNSYGKFLQETEMFSQNFSQAFLKALSLQVKEISFSKGETIFRDRENELVDEHSFYFIKNGSVIIHPHLKTKSPEKTYLNKLKAGQHFGEWSFFTGMSRQASAEAHSYSLMYYIKRNAFIQTLKRFDDDYEYYCLMRDKLVMQNDLSVIGCQCWTCGSYQHMSTHCNLTHYRPKVDFILNQDMDNDRQQERQIVVRGLKSKWPTILNQQKLVKVLKQKRINFLKNQRQTRNNSVVGDTLSAFLGQDKQSQRSQSLYGNQQFVDEKFQDQQQKQIEDEMLHHDSQIKNIQDDNQDLNLLPVRESLVKIDEQMEPLYSQIEEQQIQTGLINFDKPHQFKRYKYNENRQNMWTTDGKLQKKKD